jgi:hypothetical protein
MPIIIITEENATVELIKQAFNDKRGFDYDKNSSLVRKMIKDETSALLTKLRNER